MADTWGHMYPEGGSKHDGYIVFAIGTYGNEIIIESTFHGIGSSPQRYELDHSIFNVLRGLEFGVYKVECTMWFYKNCDDLLGPPGKLIKLRDLNKLY